LDKFEIATLVSLLPVAAITFSFLQDRITFPHSSLELSAIRCSLDEVILAASNTGERPGIIGSGVAQRLVNGNVEGGLLTLLPPASAVALSAGSSTIISMAVRKDDVQSTGGTLLPTPSGQTCVYHMVVNVVEFGGRRPAPRSLECQCPGSPLAL
jgi:hypothetical protein